VRSGRANRVDERCFRITVDLGHEIGRRALVLEPKLRARGGAVHLGGARGRGKRHAQQFVEIR
jgi:hypothetical protein